VIVITCWAVAWHGLTAPMGAGRVVEEGPTNQIFGDPSHALHNRFDAIHPARLDEDGRHLARSVCRLILVDQFCGACPRRAPRIMSQDGH